jgi:ferredoxin
MEKSVLNNQKEKYMKKSAVLTYYHFTNYGTILQLYGLNKTIQNMGIVNDVIDYIPGPTYKEPMIKRMIKYHFFYIDRLRFLAKNYLYRKYIIKTNENIIIDIKNKTSKFDLFRASEFTFSKRCKTSSDLFQLNDCYDAFVCGSDQVWSPHAFNPKYYFDFISDTNTMIAYAPSIGEDHIKNQYITEKMSKLIRRFSHLSVREDSGVDIIQGLTQKNSLHVLDPSMLLDKDEYDKIINKYVKQHENGQYILCYFLADKERYWKCIKKITKETKIPVKVIPIFYKDYTRPFDCAKETGPAEFLQLIRDAAIVCTDSFHGTIFSILYNKAFFSFERFHKYDPENQNSRIYSLLRMFSLEDRLIYNYKDIKLKLRSIIDFNRVNRVLDKQKNISIKYLSDALQSAFFHKSKEDNFVITNTCSGCGSCELVCKNRAIKIILNDKGFYESVVDNNLCLYCKECRSVCPYGNSAPAKITYKHSLFAVYSKNPMVLKTSSSGGLGREIAEYFHNSGADVFGCTYNVLKRRAETICIHPHESDKIITLSGSKYIQSNMSGIYDKIHQSNGGVFFGTPCQAVGVNSFLQKYDKRKSFILVDLICHGIPSDLLWQKYLAEGDRKYQYDMNPDVQFRYKKYGWEKKYIYVARDKKTYIKRDTKDLFYKFFLAGSCNMDACYECKFRDSSSADIRMGDYWGPRFGKNKKGVSMAVPMSDAGDAVLKKLQKNGQIFIEKTDINDYFNCQQTVNIPKPVEYDYIIGDLRNNDVSLAVMADKYRRYYEISNTVYNLLYPIIRTVKIHKKQGSVSLKESGTQERL